MWEITSSASVRGTRHGNAEQKVTVAIKAGVAAHSTRTGSLHQNILALSTAMTPDGTIGGSLRRK